MERDTEEGERKMKGIKFVLGFVMIITMFFGINTVLTFVDNTVTRECEVECLVDNVAYFKDGFGDVWGWECEKGEGYYLGQKVYLIMNTNNTKKIEDDFILKIKIDK